MTLPPDSPARENAASKIALAPDGSSFAYLGITDGIRHLFVRFLDQPTGHALAGTDGASAPFYSPDGRWIGFMAGGQMKKVPVSGGAPVTITRWSGVVTGATWGSRGMIVFSSWADRGLWKIPAAGGTAEVLARPDLGAIPDGPPGKRRVTIEVSDVRTGAVRQDQDAPPQRIVPKIRGGRLLGERRYLGPVVPGPHPVPRRHRLLRNREPAAAGCPARRLRPGLPGVE